jgi:hypothetical protein
MNAATAVALVVSKMTSALHVAKSRLREDFSAKLQSWGGMVEEKTD